jgi:hypothetical protein
MLMALVSGRIMQSRDARRLWALVPLRDLFASAIWALGLFGNAVVWRGQRLRIDAEGRIR